MLLLKRIKYFFHPKGRKVSPMRHTDRLSKIMALVFIDLLMVGILACERRQPSLIGTWQSASGETFEFFKDGTVRMRGDLGRPFGVQTVIGNYRLIDGNRIRLDMTALGSNINLIIAYSITRDTLTLKNEEKGEVSTYRRVEESDKREGSGLARQMSDLPRRQAAQTPASKPQAESLPQPQAEPKAASGSFSLDEEEPLSAPGKQAYAPPAPRAAPPPQATWGGRWPWTSERLILADDLLSLSLLELELMRNEIYARHGWVFNRRDLQDYFARQPWYSPKGNPSTREQANRWAQAELTSLEKKNIQMIVSREKALKR